MLAIFFFNDTATTEIYTLSLHDALPILASRDVVPVARRLRDRRRPAGPAPARAAGAVGGAQRSFPGGGGARPGESRARPARRSEEHTSELQSRQYLVCRLLLEKKKQHYT